MSHASAENLLGRVERGAIYAAVPAAALSAVGYLSDRPQFLRSYLVAFLFILGLSLGALSLSLLHFLTGGRWGAAIRRFLEAATAVLPLLAILFLPLAFHVREIYPWAAEGDSAMAEVAAEVQHHGKDLYLNVPFFTYRAIGYFAFWILWGALVNRASAAYARDPNLATMRRLQLISGFGLAGYGLTVTFAAIDWGMSLEPLWFSTMYGVLFLVGNGLSALAASTGAAIALRNAAPFSADVSRDRLHDLGNLHLALVMMWAYVSFSQFLIVWSGNLPEETPWYFYRSEGGWKAAVLVLTIFHFVVPFFVLLSRDAKRSPQLLAGLTIGILVMRLVDLTWLIKPAPLPPVAPLHWLDLTTLLTIGGVWLWACCMTVRKRLDIPVVLPQ